MQSVYESQLWSSVNTFLSEFSRFPARMHDSAVNMATGIRDRIDAYRNVLTMRQAPDDDKGKRDVSLIIIQHRKVIDTIRKRRPKLYAELLRLAKDKRMLTQQEMDRLRLLVTMKV